MKCEEPNKALEQERKMFGFAGVDMSFLETAKNDLLNREMEQPAGFNVIALECSHCRSERIPTEGMGIIDARAWVDAHKNCKKAEENKNPVQVDSNYNWEFGGPA